MESIKRRARSASCSTVSVVLFAVTAVACPSRALCITRTSRSLIKQVYFLVFFAPFLDMFFRLVFWKFFLSFLVLLGSLRSSFWGLFEHFFWVFFEVRKRVPSKRLSGWFLVPANPRQPKYSLGQTQFYANQCFSVSTAFLVQKRVQKEVKCQTFGSFFDTFFQCFLKVFFGVVFWVS